MTEAFRALPAKEQQIAALHSVRAQLQAVINATGIDVKDRELIVDEDTLTIKSHAATLKPFPGYTPKSDRFLFSGSLLVPGPISDYIGLAELGVSEAATIHHFQVPTSLRENGVGREIETAWVDAWRAHDVHTFLAKGIRDGSDRFWLSLGYRLVEKRFPGIFVSAHTPRHMIKTR